MQNRAKMKVRNVNACTHVNSQAQATNHIGLSFHTPTGISYCIIDHGQEEQYDRNNCDKHTVVAMKYPRHFASP
jgi:hypothetical protein